MNHLSVEELIGHAYGEGASGTAQHLEVCAECGRAFAELKNDLGELVRLEAPERSAEYGAEVWQAIAPTLPLYAKPRRSWFGSRLLWGVSYAAVCTLLVAGAFYAGQRWEHARRPTMAANPAPKAKQPVVIVVLGDHLDRSERLLVELKHVDAANQEMVSPLRDEARSLLAANAVCRRKAEEKGDPELEGALDHLDHLLNEMANQPNGMNAAAIARLKQEMNADGLLFEVRVLRSRVHEDKNGSGERSKGGEI